MHEGAKTVAELFDLGGRVALVTGASSGLGAAVARTLAAAGAMVAITARRADRLAELADEIGAEAFACDLLDPAQVDALVPAVVDRCGGLGILVNAAGHIVEVQPAERERPEAVARTVQLNLLAPFRLCQLAFDHLEASGHGAVVNISSISGHVGIPSIPQASYAASKAALSGLTVELAVQWARHSIRVNTVAPGFFRSEITAASLFDSDKGQQWLARNTPLPVQGSVDDFVGAVLWLVSDAGRYTTGQTIVIDGGWTAR